jgi:RNA polymerase sigma-70 factor (ECF subfamily)
MPIGCPGGLWDTHPDYEAGHGPKAVTRQSVDVRLEDYDAVYERHYQDVYRAVRAIVLDPAMAEDVTQEAFVKAYRVRATYKPTGSLGGWLHRIAVNLAISHVRWRSLQARVLQTVGLESQGPKPDPRLHDLVSELLDALKPEARAAIVLYHFHGYRYREIAEILGVPEGTVATRISTGLRRMRLVLKSRSEEIDTYHSLAVVDAWKTKT